MASAGRMLTSEEYRKLWVGVLRDECGVRDTAYQTEGLAVTRTHRRGWRGLALVALLGELGLRIAEAVGVPWWVFDPVRRGEMVVQLPGEICKGGHSRQVVVTPAARWVLAVWAGVGGWAKQSGYARGWNVVRCGDGELGVRGGQKIVERFGRRYLGRQVGCHDLRRTFGDRVRRVADVRIAQLMLGHVRLSSTERYLGGSLSERVSAGIEIDRDLWPDGFSLERVGEWPVATVAAGALPQVVECSPGKPSGS